MINLNTCSTSRTHHNTSLSILGVEIYNSYIPISDNMSRKKSCTDNNICQRIKELRLKLRLSGVVFSNNIGISQGYLSDIENFRAVPNKTLLLATSYAYNVNFDYLLKGEGDPYIKDRVGGDIPEDDPHRELLSMTREILTSDTDYSVSLSANIKSFHKALVTEKSLEQRVTALEEQHEKIIKQKLTSTSEAVNYK